MKSALITGITGQDGAYLASYLLDNNYLVYGAYRRASSINFWRLNELGITNHDKLKLIDIDLIDFSSIIRLIDSIKPDEIYNLAAQSFVHLSFDQPITTAEITAKGPLNILEAIRLVNKKIKFYQASSSEMFGLVQETPQNEKTKFYPRSPYGVSKLFAHWMCINYRESYDMHACNGILFNHESPLRGKEFVTRKITNNVAKIKLGLIDSFDIGNMDALRDWGFAKDYVVGMHKILNHDIPDDFVLATGSTYSVKDFLLNTFDIAGIKVIFEGSGLNQVIKNKDSNKTLVKINPAFYRPSEVDLLIGDYSKAKKDLDWQPNTSFKELCEIMYKADLDKVKNNFEF